MRKSPAGTYSKVIPSFSESMTLPMRNVGMLVGVGRSGVGVSVGTGIVASKVAVSTGDVTEDCPSTVFATTWLVVVGEILFLPFNNALTPTIPSTRASKIPAPILYSFRLELGDLFLSHFAEEDPDSVTVSACSCPSPTDLFSAGLNSSLISSHL